MAWKFLFKLLENGDYSNWDYAGILLLGKGILEAEYDDIAEEYEKKIVEEQFFGVRCRANAPVNLTVVKESSGKLQLDDGPIEVCID